MSKYIVNFNILKNNILIEKETVREAKSHHQAKQIVFHDYIGYNAEKLPYIAMYPHKSKLLKQKED